MTLERTILDTSHWIVSLDEAQDPYPGRAIAEPKQWIARFSELERDSWNELLEIYHAWTIGTKSWRSAHDTSEPVEYTMIFERARVELIPKSEAPVSIAGFTFFEPGTDGYQKGAHLSLSDGMLERYRAELAEHLNTAFRTGGL